MDCSLITDFQQSTAIRIAKRFRNLHIGQVVDPLWSAFNTVEKSSIHGQEGSIPYLPSNYPLIILSGYVNK